MLTMLENYHVLYELIEKLARKMALHSSWIPDPNKFVWMFPKIKLRAVPLLWQQGKGIEKEPKSKNTVRTASR